MTDLERVRDDHAAQARMWITFACQAEPGTTNAAHLDRQAAHHARLAATWQRYIDREEPSP